MTSKSENNSGDSRQEDAEMLSEAPNLFAYDNYRTFLRDRYDWLKQQKKAFSFRFLSREAGFRSSNFILLVMKGERNLTGESIGRVAKAIKLNAQETEFFRNLVLLNQAKSVAERERFAKELMRFKAYKEIKPLAEAQYNYWSKWYNVPIREILELSCFCEDPNWIAKILRPKITPEEARRAIDQLLELGVLKRNKKGQLVQTDESITSGDEVSSNFVEQFHQEMIQKGKEAMDRFPAEIRDVSSVTLCLSEDNISEVKKLLGKLRQDIVATTHKPKNKSNREAVYQINFQLFPVTDFCGDE